MSGNAERTVLSRLVPATLLILSVGFGVMRPLPRANVRAHRHAGVNQMASAEPSDGNDGEEQSASRARTDAPRFVPVVATGLALLTLLVLRMCHLPHVPVAIRRLKLPSSGDPSLPS